MPALQLTRTPADAAGQAARRAALRSSFQTPGAYMRECRTRAGRSIEWCAQKISAHAGEYRGAEIEIARLEADEPGNYSQLVSALDRHRAFAFDKARFLSLAAATCAPALDDWGA